MNGIIVLLLQARTLFHVKHLLSKNFNEHIILNELYDSILERTDQLAEVYQGKYNDLTINSLPSISMEGDSLQHALEIRKDLEDFINSEENENDQINAILDETINDFSRAIYKLRMR